MPKTISSDYFAVHAHSEYSVLDGMGSVADMVDRVSRLGQPAMALTDHGSMAGCIRLYKECTKAGIAPFPGIEAYVVSDVTEPDGRERRFHLGLLALDFEGYKALVALSSRSNHPDRFHRRPLIDQDDLRTLGKDHGQHVAVTTGCYFGMVVQALLEGDEVGKRKIAWLQSIFPNLFVEVQNHGITHDDGTTDAALAMRLLDIAADLGLPVVLGQDSHYCEASHQPVHDLMKSICYFGEDEDAGFPGGPYHLASTGALRRAWSSEQWATIEEGHGHLLDLNRVRLPALDDYRFHVPAVSTTPDSTLKRLAKRGLGDAGFDGHSGYEARVKHELEVVKAKGFANYFLEVYEIVTWCKKQGIFIDARGSANGSLVCYLLGITTVDPIQWSCDFSRFLSLDRAKPPDIDLDVESDRRDDLIDYVRSRHPTMVQIGTYGRIGITETPDGEEKGSVYVQYAAAKRKRYGHYDGIAPEDRPYLEALGDMDVRKSAGRHAGGFVLPGAGLPIEDYIPTMLVGGKKNGHTVTQPTMDDVEDCGYVKLDILGVKQLSTMRRCMELIGKDPVRDGMTWIPDDDKKACTVLRSGVAGNGVFQFEGYSTAIGAKQMKVQNTQEAIFCIALFRPAMMLSGMTDRYLAARASKQREHRGHPAIDRIMDDTWGVPVFQDQVIEMMRVVGLPVDELNALLKAVKASNDKIAEYAQQTFDRVYPIFTRCTMKNLGVDRDTSDRIWQTVMEFSDYGFNRSHATNYGIRGYRMAYLKSHYPTEFMAATLSTWTGTDKEAKYIKEARRTKMVVGRPDVNKSEVLWTSDGPLKLRRGLLSIKGVGASAAEAIVAERQANGPYADVDDFSARLPAKQVTGVNDLPKGDLKGTCKVLVEAGAFRSLGVDPHA